LSKDMFYNGYSMVIYSIGSLTMSLKRDTLANAIGIFSNMASLWLISILIVRITGYKDAGTFAIALSGANIFASIASFSIRFYYSADTMHRFSDMQYYFSRFITVSFSLIVCFVTILLMQYKMEICLAILLYYFCKCVEMASDILFGTMQRYGKLYYSGYSMFLKSFGSLILFTIALYITHCLNAALLTMFLFELFVFIVYDIGRSISLSKETVDRTDKDWQRAFQLLLVCIPLFFVTLCYNFIPSIPRIIFEWMYTEQELGYYASLSTITVLISTAINCIAIPIIPRLSEAFRQGDRKRLTKSLSVMLAVTICIGLCGCIGYALIGESVLVLIFGEKIRQYAYLMNGMIAASTLTALISCYINFFVAAEKLKQLIVSSIVGLCICILCVFPFCKWFYMDGLVYCLLLSQGMELLFLGIFLKKIIGGLTNGE